MTKLSETEFKLLCLVNLRSLSGPEIKREYLKVALKPIVSGTIYAAFRRLKARKLVVFALDKLRDRRQYFVSASKLGTKAVKDAWLRYSQLACFGMYREQ